MPNSKIDMVLSIIIQNGGEVSKRKREQLEALLEGQILNELYASVLMLA